MMVMIQCNRCNHVGPEKSFYRGRGRDKGEHPEHQYCPNCGESITWYGYKVIYRENPGKEVGEAGQ